MSVRCDEVRARNHPNWPIICVLGYWVKSERRDCGVAPGFHQYWTSRWPRDYLENWPVWVGWSRGVPHLAGTGLIITAPINFMLPAWLYIRLRKQCAPPARGPYYCRALQYYAKCPYDAVLCMQSVLITVIITVSVPEIRSLATDSKWFQ